MAKSSKHSPALFEVVHGKKHFDKTARETSLRTPSWWFKGRKRMSAIGALSPAGGAAAVEDPPPFGEGDIPPSVADPTENPSMLADRERERQADRERQIDRQADEAPVDPMAIPAALTAPSRSRRRSPFQFVVDRDRHELFVRVRYTTAVVAGVSVLVLIALAYLTGRNTGRGPTAAMASATSEEIAAGAVEKGVLDLSGRRRGTAAPVASAPGGSGPAAVHSPVPPVVARTNPAGNAITPPAPTPAAGAANRLPRTINLQYVVIQSYPGKEKQMADEACEYLNRAGIPCTVERGVPGYASADWYCVVGTTAFERASGPAYEKYLQEIEKVNDKYAGKSRFKRFAPGAVRWRGTSG